MGIKKRVRIKYKITDIHNSDITFLFFLRFCFLFIKTLLHLQQFLLHNIKAMLQRPIILNNTSNNKQCNSNQYNTNNNHNSICMLSL